MPSEFSSVINDSEYESWKDQTNEHPAVKNHGDIVVKHKSFIFYKIMTFLFLIVFCCFVYLIYDGKIQITNNSYSTINNQMNQTNNYDINTPVQNSYSNNNEYNITVQVYPKIYLNSTG